MIWLYLFVCLVFCRQKYKTVYPFRIILQHFLQLVSTGVSQSREEKPSV